MPNIPQNQSTGKTAESGYLHTDYLETAGVDEFEHIRENLRELIKYIKEKEGKRYDTDFADELLAMEWKESELENDDLKNYKAKAEYYVRRHQDNEAIARLKNNQPLTAADVQLLEEILWQNWGQKKSMRRSTGRSRSENLSVKLSAWI